MKRFKIVYKFIAFLIVFFSLSYSLLASHMIGGDITYRCLGNYQFEITLTLFQDCLHGEELAIEQDNPAQYAIYNASPNPTLHTFGQVYSVFQEIVNPNFSNDCVRNPPPTCLRRQVFRFRVTLPPSEFGYYIVYQRCCRNASITNIVNPGNVGVTYSAKIPPFSTNECPNNSAVFETMPPQIICVNNPFIYDFSAVDPDNDSLTYRLCAAHPGGSPSDPIPSGGNISPPEFPNVPYLPPYSPNMPMSGTPPIQINPVTGEMTATPNVSGRFVVSVCVDEWRNGEIINTLSRDVQFVVTNCSKAVIANIPELESEPNTYIIQCDGYHVFFQNRSRGGDTYYWEFGVPGATSTEFEPSFTYPDTGTYLVKLVVNRGTTCADSIYRYVKIYPEYHADFEWSGLLCPDEPIQFKDLSEATYPPIASWQWDFGDGNTSEEQNPTHIYAAPGGEKQVRLISKSMLGCVDTVIKKLPLSYFKPNAGNDTVIVLGYDFSLNGTGAQFYRWEPSDYLSDPNIPNPQTFFPEVGKYTYVLYGSNEEGCHGTDTVVIWVTPEDYIFVPNVFSPNGDGNNDLFMPKIAGYSIINSFIVFNRWGEEVYSSVNNNEPGWDGTFKEKDAEVGVYYWVITCTNPGGEKVMKKGDVTLVR